MVRNIRVFRYSPVAQALKPAESRLVSTPVPPDQGHFDSFTLAIPDEAKTTILDVLVRLREEQDPTLAFRFACRVAMCGSCGMVINGTEALACKTNVSQIPPGKEITIRPLNHFPVIKDLVVDMEPFFKKYDDVLPFYEPKQDYAEPAQIRPDSQERLDIGGATECIACGCCVSSCTMAHYHEGYAGPAALNRAFTLLADSRDGLFDERLTRALESCYHCRTEFNCTEVCPKDISSTRAIKYIQRLALKENCRRSPAKGAEALRYPDDAHVAQGHAAFWRGPAAFDRRAFLTALLGAGSAAVLGVIGAGVVAGPALSKPARQWVPVAALDNIRPADVTTVLMKYELKNGIYTERVSAPVLVSRTGDEMACFNATCPHLGCMVRWDGQSARFRCACHGGNFDRDGTVLAGPPPRGLDRYAFKVEAGHLLVEVG